MSSPQPPASYVLDPPPAAPADAARHFLARLATECDPWDVHADLRRGVTSFVVADARTPEAYADLHLPGAISLPNRDIDERAAAHFRERDLAVVVYCWGPACNAATKAAAKLAGFGVRVKEMIGGLEAWVNEGYTAEGALPPGVPFADYLRWHHVGTGGQFPAHLPRRPR